jgi:general secretion pathway protein C
MIMATMLKLWTMRLTTFLLWALAAGSAAFWVLQGTKASAGSTAQGQASNGFASALPLVPATSVTPVSLAPQVAAALGAKTAPLPTAASQLAAAQARFQLMGVLALGSKNGAALIAVDGKPAKPYRVGVAIEDGLEVTAVAARSVSIGSNGSAAFTLELPFKN